VAPLPGEPIEAPRPVAGRRGLLAAASTPAASPARWENGVAFQAAACDALEPLPWVLCRTEPAELATIERGAASGWTPIALLGFDRCSALDGDGPERRQRAEDNLNATASWQAEREFFDGVATTGLSDPPGPNPYLTDGSATEVTGGPHTHAVALARLEQELAECLHGQRGMIHATPEVVTLWAAEGLVRTEGGLLVTAVDSIVVAGSGYSGNDPDGAAPAAGSSWAYGTSLVYALRGPVIDLTPDLVARIDTGDDTLTYRLMQASLVYRSTCCTVAVQVATTAAP
jgi:hypothetical protein